MSANIVKRMAPHQKRKAPTKRKHGTPVNSCAPEGPSGRFWTQWIAPNNAALLSQTLRPCHVVVKNHGAHNILLVADHGDLMDLSPGDVRATYAHGAIRVENHADEAVLIEFEFVPLIKK